MKPIGSLVISPFIIKRNTVKDHTVEEGMSRQIKRKTFPLALLHDVTHPHAQTETRTHRHKVEADLSDFPLIFLLVCPTHSREYNPTVCLCLYHPVCVCVHTSGPGCHVCHLLKSIQEGSGHHDGRPESETNTTHTYIH